MSVEHRHSPEGKDKIISYMKCQNFTLLKEVNDVYGTPIDLLLAKNNVISSLNVSAMPEQIPLTQPATMKSINSG